MSSVTLKSLKLKASKLSNHIPFLLEISKERNKDVCWITRLNGLEGSDVLFVGTANECESFLLGMELILNVFLN